MEWCWLSINIHGLDHTQHWSIGERGNKTGELLYVSLLFAITNCPDDGTISVSTGNMEQQLWIRTPRGRIHNCWRATIWRYIRQTMSLLLRPRLVLLRCPYCNTHPSPPLLFQLTLPFRVQDLYGREMAHWLLQYGFEAVGKGFRLLLWFFDGKNQLLDEEIWRLSR